MQCPFCKSSDKIQSHYMKFMGKQEVTFVCNGCGGEFTKEFAKEVNDSGFPLLSCSKNSSHQAFGEKGKKCPHAFCRGVLV
ncbi:hypothetical protein V7201_21160 [Bacillus sp. JJ1122]|uniref:hypothetical protein n=1 Tax=Bacillus sp. JJ1122 TaxID=3122951 RepID=UPI0030009CEA